MKSSVVYCGHRDARKPARLWDTDTGGVRGSCEMDGVKGTATTVMIDGRGPGGSANAGG